MSRKLSVALFPLSMGGSNASKLELDAIFVPPYNAGKFGLTLTTSPYQADIVLLHGVGTVKAAPMVQRLLAALPPDTKLVLLGSESIRAVPFKTAYGVAGPPVLVETRAEVSKDAVSKAGVTTELGTAEKAELIALPTEPTQEEATPNITPDSVAKVALETEPKVDIAPKLVRLVLPPGKQISAFIVGSPPDPQSILDGILAVAATFDF